MAARSSRHLLTEIGPRNATIQAVPATTFAAAAGQVSAPSVGVTITAKSGSAFGTSGTATVVAAANPGAHQGPIYVTQVGSGGRIGRAMPARPHLTAIFGGVYNVNVQATPASAVAAAGPPTGIVIPVNVQATPAAALGSSGKATVTTGAGVSVSASTSAFGATSQSATLYIDSTISVVPATAFATESTPSVVALTSTNIAITAVPAAAFGTSGTATVAAVVNVTAVSAAAFACASLAIFTNGANATVAGASTSSFATSGLPAASGDANPTVTPPPAFGAVSRPAVSAAVGVTPPGAGAFGASGMPVVQTAPTTDIQIKAVPAAAWGANARPVLSIEVVLSASASVFIATGPPVLHVDIVITSPSTAAFAAARGALVLSRSHKFRAGKTSPTSQQGLVQPTEAAGRITRT